MSKPENLNTIKRGCQDLIYKEKGSKFIGFARHVGNAQEALDFFDSLKKNIMVPITVVMPTVWE